MNELQKNHEQLIFGLDIGTRSVVGMVGYRKHSHDFTVIAQATRFHETRAMLDGQIHNINAVAQTIGEVRRELEDKIGAKLTDVCIAAAGRVLKTCQIRTDYDLGDDMIITDELIRSMELIGVEQAHEELRRKTAIKPKTKTETDLSENINYFCVGYSVVKYYLGDIAINNLEGHKGRRIGADILATFLPQDVIDGLYAATMRAQLNVVNLTLEPIAAINVAIPEKFRLLNLALVDVGAGTSDICITQGGSVTAYGMIPCAGDYLTESIMQNYLVEFNTAEEIKLSLEGKKKKIAYKDILGNKCTVGSDEVSSLIAAPINSLTKDIAARIKELNGGKPVSAIFIVGGGGKVKGFAEALAQAAGLGKERVALRGEEVMNEITFKDTSAIKDSTLVTPVGICLNYYEQNNNFIFVKCNGDLVKLYDNGKLTVMDAASGIGIANEKIFPRRGRELAFTINGERRLIRGEVGESAVITVNGQPASITTPIVRNDVIVVDESTAGHDAYALVSDLAESRRTISFYVNGKKVVCPRLITCGGKIVSMSYAIRNSDDIKVLDYYTVDKLVEYMDVSREGTILVNNIIALGDEKLYENFTVDFGISEANRTFIEKTEQVAQAAVAKTSAPAPASDTGFDRPASAQPAGRAITINLNGSMLTLSGKQSYVFVDILDFYKFDTVAHLGESIVMRVGGIPAEFTTPIEDDAQVELYWQK